MNPLPDGSFFSWAQFVRDWATALTFMVALGAGLFGLLRYLRSERIRKTEQVRELYVMFFDSPRYRRIRFILAYPNSPEFQALRAELESHEVPKEMEGELIDLLNFLEFVSGLVRRGLVARIDIDWMFASFIDRIASIDFIRDYIQRHDFEELGAICRRQTRALMRKSAHAGRPEA